jgi:salicylate hydroxylase
LEVNPRWVWNVDLEGMLGRAREVFEDLKNGRGGEGVVDV